MKRDAGSQREGCAVLCCAVLCCAVLCGLCCVGCVVLCCAVWAVLCCVGCAVLCVLCCAVLCCAVLYCTGYSRDACPQFDLRCSNANANAINSMPGPDHYSFSQLLKHIF